MNNNFWIGLLKTVVCPNSYKYTLCCIQIIILKMSLKESPSIKEVKGKIVYYENQRHLASQELSIVRQQLECIDHFFVNYGYDNEFNIVTQTTANDRVRKESLFDKIVNDIQHFNKMLTELNDNLHALCSRDALNKIEEEK